MAAAQRGDPSDRDIDDDLIRRVAQADTAAWPVLVERHLKGIVGHAWYMLGDQTEAEDVAQESFVRLMAKVAAWEPGGAKLRTWLYRVTTNLCIDRQRARKSAPGRSLDAAENVGAPDPELDHRIDQRMVVRKALDGLPEKQKLAMVLIYYQGLTNKEAAAVMGSSVEAVESLLSRARRTLRRDLDPDIPDLLGASV